MTTLRRLSGGRSDGFRKIGLRATLLSGTLRPVMRLQTVLDLKADLRGRATAQAVGLGALPNKSGMVKVAGTSLPLARSLGVILGIAPGGSANDFRIAVRTTRLDQAVRQYVNTLGLITSGDIEQQHVGDILAAPPIVGVVQPWQQRSRPILPGCSVGHRYTTAGTIGAIVNKDGVMHVLSNNHVLALSAGVANDANHDDPIVQPGPYDGGAHPGDSIARLAKWVPLKAGVNYVDAALGAIDDNLPYDASYAGARLSGIAQAQVGAAVWKIGRTTGVTRGTITAVALDDVPVGYNDQTLYFDNQTEIQGDSGLFSQGGDSGSLIVDADRNAIGLLFAGSTARAKTYANPIETVLQLVGGSLLS